MKKITLVIFSFLVLSVFSSKSYSQVYEQGNMVIDAYYGWPNLWTAVVKSAYNSDPSFDTYGVKIGSIGPIGAKYEYLISERIGIGANFNYANTSVKATTDNGYDYKGSLPRWRLMAMVNIHIGKSDKVDPYVAFGAGYSSLKVKEETNDPNYVEGSVDLNIVPVAARAEFGVRYFFIPNLGITGSFGIGGGPLLAAGVAAKF